ncbi:MAG: methyltransferase regulatory domain-containing protein [Pseudomonadota bacterium]
MLTPRGQQSSKEGATEAFKRFEKLYNSKIGIYPQLGPQYQSIHARFKIDPDYVVHDFFQSATTLSFEDFSDMAEENDLEFAASANLAQMLPEGFVSEAVMTQFDFSSDWIGSQPLIQTLTKEPVRIDIFARSGVAREPEEVFADGGVSNLYVSSLTDNLSTALQVKNSGSPIDLTGEAYSQLASLIGTGPHRIRDIIKQATDMLGSRTEVIRKLGHLIAYGLVSASVHDCAADDGQDDVSLKAFSYADDLWRYLALNRPLPIPSETLGGCFVFNNDAKIKLYLALGGDPNTLFNRVKRTPGFSDMRTQKGIVKSGQDLMTTVAPVLPGFKTAWQAIFKRFNII